MTDRDKGLQLYTYFRSSAAYRVRIALNLKGLKPELHFVHLLRGGGEQLQPGYRAVNPQSLVPALVVEGHALAQSLAIIEYLEETHPEPPLLPKDALGRARVRRLATMVACDIHPLNNLRVLRRLRGQYGLSEDALKEWQQHWITLGFTALEALVANAPETGRYCHGDTPTLADICLVPQMANARRIATDLSPFPTLVRIEQTALSHPAFDAAQPKVQPDAE
jgi:maleylpyruvate isomerase